MKLEVDKETHQKLIAEQDACEMHLVKMHRLAGQWKFLALICEKRAATEGISEPHKRALLDNARIYKEAAEEVSPSADMDIEKLFK